VSLSLSRLAYRDCFDVLERAQEDPKGARVRMADGDSAHYFRMRLYQARKLERIDNQRIYTKDNVMWGKSAYDGLMIRVRYEEETDLWWVYLEHMSIDPLRIETLSGDDHADRLPSGDLEPSPQLRSGNGPLRPSEERQSELDEPPVHSPKAIRRF